MEEKAKPVLEDILELTKRLSSALKSQNLDEAGKTLKSRGILLESCKKKFKPENFNDGEKEILKQISLLDQEARVQAEIFKAQLQAKMELTHKRGDAWKGYYQAMHNLLNGQIVNKKR